MCRYCLHLVLVLICALRGLVQWRTLHHVCFGSLELRILTCLLVLSALLGSPSSEELRDFVSHDSLVFHVLCFWAAPCTSGMVVSFGFIHESYLEALI